MYSGGYLLLEQVCETKLIPDTNLFVLSKADLLHTCDGKLVGEGVSRLSSLIISNLVSENVHSDNKFFGSHVKRC